MLERCCVLLLLLGIAQAELGRTKEFRFPPVKGQAYNPGLIRRWALNTDEGQCFRFAIKDLNIELTNNCVNDYVEVYDGPTTSANRLVRACGFSKNIPQPVKTTSNKILVVFRSDDNEQTGRGFEASVTSIRCGNSGITGGSSSRTCGKPAIAPNETDFHVKRHRRQNAFPPVMFGDGTPTDAAVRIVGGQAANPHSWPWQVSIRFRGNHICGGSLVSARHIVTAAHCFKTVSMAADDFEFWVGKHMKDEREPTYEQKLYGEEIIMHPDYDKRKHDADLVIVRLRTPAKFTNYVSPICLPASRTEHPRDNTKCFVTGFGTTHGTGDSDKLKQAAVPTIGNDQCKTMESRLKPILTKNMFCAGYYEGGHDSCQGDSGGPLACKVGENDSWVLSGVVSFGFGCAGANSPGVYVRTAEFLPWFNENINDIQRH